MNAMCKAQHLNSLSYSRKMVLSHVQREPTRYHCQSSICNQQLLIAASHQNPTLLSKTLPKYTSTQSIHLLTDDDKSKVPTSEIRRLVKANLQGYKEGYSCIVVNCPSCNTQSVDSQSDLGKLYINLRTGYCFCTQCFLQGPWSSLDTYIRAVEMSNLKSGKSPCPPNITQHLSQYTPSAAESNEMRRLWNSAQAINSLSEETLVPFLDKLRLGDISMDTLEKVGAKVNLNLEQLIVPCVTNQDVEFHGLKILTPKRNSSQPEQTDTDGIEERNFPRQHPWLLGYHLASRKNEIILTATVADTLTALDCLAVPALCLPSGIAHLPLATMAFLEPFRKITFWLDNGVKGSESARAFARKLGENRCHFIRPSEETPSAHQSRLKGKNLVHVVKAAVPVTHKAVTTFASLRKEVYDEIIQKDSVAGVRWRRFPVLTDLLKGHRRGELTIFTGPTGAGKTTFLSEYSLDLCGQDVRTLWGSFEIRNVRLAKMMLQQFSGLMLESEPELFDVVADEFEKLPMYFMSFHGQQNVQSVLEAMSHAVYVQDISHIVIDNLQFMMGTSADSSLDRFHRQDQIIGSFRRFATDNNVHITLVIHPRKEVDELSTSSIFGGAKASQEADNILILQDKRTHDPTHRRKYLEVAKNRYAGDLGVMPLEFHKESLSFAPRKRAKTVKKPVVSTTYSTSTALQSGREGNRS